MLLLFFVSSFLEQAAGMIPGGTPTLQAAPRSSFGSSVRYSQVAGSTWGAGAHGHAPPHPRVRSVDIVEPAAAAAANSPDHSTTTGAFRLAPLKDDIRDGKLMLTRPARYGMCMTRACFLATVIPLGMAALWYEQLTGHKQTAYIEAAMANWWRLTNVGTVGLWREGTVLTAAEMGMEPVGVANASAWMGSGAAGSRGRGAWSAFATNVLEGVSVLELVYRQAEFSNVPTLRFLDADVKTLKDMGTSLGADGFAAGDACFAGELASKTGGWRNSFVLPEVYHGGRAVGLPTSVPTGILDSCVLGETAFNPALAYRYGVASLVAVLEQAHLHEQLDQTKNYHDRPVASIETVAKTLGVWETQLYQNLPETLKTRASLLQLARTGSAIFTNLNLAQFVLVMMLAHGTDPRGVASNWYLRDYLKALVPEAYFSQVVHFLLPKLNLAARRYTKLAAGVQVRVRFPGGQPGGANSWIQDKNHMAPGYPFTPLEAESFFPNFVPNEVWATGVVERVENGNNAVPKVHIRVTQGCNEQRPGDDDLESAVPSKAVQSGRFACPKIDLTQYPGVTVATADGVVALGSVHENMHITLTGEQTIAEMVRSPVEQHVAVLEDGPFAQLKQINSLDLETSIDDKVNAGKDVEVGAEEMVGVLFWAGGGWLEGRGVPSEGVLGGVIQQTRECLRRVRPTCGCRRDSSSTQRVADINLCISCINYALYKLHHISTTYVFPNNTPIPQAPRRFFDQIRHVQQRPAPPLSSGSHQLLGPPHRTDARRHGENATERLLDRRHEDRCHHCRPPGWSGRGQRRAAPVAPGHGRR